MKKISWILGGMLLLVLIAAYTLELPIMMNYFEVGAFWQTGLFSGLLIAFVILGVLFWGNFSVPDNVVGKMQLASTVLFTSVLLCPLLISWANRWGIPAEQATVQTVIFESQQARFTSRFGNLGEEKKRANQFILFFFEQGQLRRVNGKEPFFSGAQTGDTISIRVNTGRLGYRWLSK